MWLLGVYRRIGNTNVLRLEVGIVVSVDREYFDLVFASFVSFVRK